ncbi:MAG: hypothetical protein WDW36_008791 [Sanguina aurantia]
MTHIASSSGGGLSRNGQTCSSSSISSTRSPGWTCLPQKAAPAATRLHQAGTRSHTQSAAAPRHRGRTCCSISAEAWGSTAGNQPPATTATRSATTTSSSSGDHSLGSAAAGSGGSGGGGGSNSGDSSGGGGSTGTLNILRSPAALREALRRLGDTPRSTSDQPSDVTTPSDQSHGGTDGVQSSSDAAMGGAQGDRSQQSAEELELGVLLEVLAGGGGGEDDEPLPDYMTRDGWGSLEEEVQSTPRHTPSTPLDRVGTSPQQASATTTTTTTTTAMPGHPELCRPSSKAAPAAPAAAMAAARGGAGAPQEGHPQPPSPGGRLGAQGQQQQQGQGQGQQGQQGQQQQRVNDDVAQGSSEWRVKRDSLLTASDMLKVLGIEPRSQYGRQQAVDKIHLLGLTACPGLDPASPRSELFLQKLGLLQSSGNAFTAYGTRMEPLARDLYCHLTGAGVEQRGLCTLRPLMQQQQGPQQQQAGGAWLGGSPDGLTTLAGRQGVLEIKCPVSKALASDSHWQYLVQIQALMEITDLDWAHLWVYKPEEGALLVSQSAARVSPAGGGVRVSGVVGGALLVRLAGAAVGLVHGRGCCRPAALLACRPVRCARQPTRGPPRPTCVLQVTIPRDRRFWDRILPLLASFHLGHVLPAKQQLLLLAQTQKTPQATPQQQQQQQQQEGEEGEDASSSTQQHTSGTGGSQTTPHQPQPPTARLPYRTAPSQQQQQQQPPSPTQRHHPLPTSAQHSSTPLPQLPPGLPAYRPTALAPQRSTQHPHTQHPHTQQRQPRPSLPVVRRFTPQQQAASPPPVSSSPWKVSAARSAPPPAPRPPPQPPPSLPPPPPPPTVPPATTRPGQPASPAWSSTPGRGGGNAGGVAPGGAAAGVGASAAGGAARVGPLSHAPWVRQGVDKSRASLVAPFVPLPKLQETQELEAWLQRMYEEAAKAQFTAEECAAAVLSFAAAKGSSRVSS